MIVFLQAPRILDRNILKPYLNQWDLNVLNFSYKALFVSKCIFLTTVLTALGYSMDHWTLVECCSDYSMPQCYPQYQWNITDAPEMHSSQHNFGAHTSTKVD